MSLETSRLTLIPSSPEHILGLIESSERFEQLLGLRVASGLRDFFVSDDVSSEWLAALRTAPGSDPWQHGFLVVHRDEEVVIGSAGFKGPPDDHGSVEIAYGIVPIFEGRGLATEAATALVEFAFMHENVAIIRAHTLPRSNASTRVLEKCGFCHAGSVFDPEDGTVWRWERGR